MSDEAFDLYGDLDAVFIEPLQKEVDQKADEERKKLKDYEDYKEKTEKLIQELKTSNFMLKKNMTLLLATARSEIERKDQQIKDLRREKDEILFRKYKVAAKNTSDKGSQTERCESSANTKSQSSNRHDSHKNDRQHSRSRSDKNYDSRKRSPERRQNSLDEYNRSRSDKYSRGSSSTKSRSSHRGKSPEKLRSKSPDRRSKYKEIQHDGDLRKVLLKKTDETRSQSREQKSKGSEKDTSAKLTKKSSLKENENGRANLSERKQSESTSRSKISSSNDNRIKTEPVEIIKMDSTEVSRQSQTKTTEVTVETTVEPEKEVVKIPSVERKNVIEETVDKGSEALKSSFYPSNECDQNEEVTNNDLNSQIILKCDDKAEAIEIAVKTDSEKIENIQEEVVKIDAHIDASTILGQIEESSNQEKPKSGVDLKLSDQSVEQVNDSFESSKENSLNNSMETKNKKRKMITTEIESDGTVVWTVTRKKRKTKEN